MVEQAFGVYERVGHVIKWGHSLQLRKIYNGASYKGSIMWNHMPCVENEDGTHTIQGPMYAECSAQITYWVSEECAAASEIVSTEEITEDDKQQMALPLAPRCDRCA